MRHSAIQLEKSAGFAETPLELAVIIPTFNETGNVEALLERLSIALAGISWEAIFVDDNSPDGTSELIREIGRHTSRVRVLQRLGRRGLSSAVVEGMLATSAPVLAVIDADMQHDESILPKLFAAVNGGDADLAVGTRYADTGSVGDWDMRRRLISTFATRIGGWVARTRLSDPMSGFFAISRTALVSALPGLSGIGFKILLDLTASTKEPLRVAEIPYQFRLREAGDSKLGARVALEYLSLLLDKTVGRIVPLRLLSFLTVGALGLGVHLAVLGGSVALGARFITAEVLAVLAAMTFNFQLNNIFTYRDRRLTGWKMVGGLLSFYAICMVGALANIGVGTWVNDTDGRWWLAGIAGAMIGAVWNFSVSSVLTWRR